MQPLFRQAAFTGGLNRLTDPTKLNRDSYPLLINGRVRSNVVSPTYKHNLLNAPSGQVQLLVEAGNYLLLVVSGMAYLADLTKATLSFQAVGGWQPMSSTAQKFYAVKVPTTYSFFTRTGEVQIMYKNFPGTVGAYPECIIVQDGINQPQSIFPDGTSKVLGTFDSWTIEVPNYVPIGTLMCFSGTKLYIVAPDGNAIYQSVSGRPTDFVINLTSDGDKGGDATTTSLAVGYNKITGLAPLSGGNFFVTTDYSGHVVLLDFDNTIFGEPTFHPDVAFPIGCVNDRSVVNVIGDTTFIASNGIQSFNFGRYVQQQTNNGPFGAKLRNLLNIPQTDTAATTFDDYALYALNTIYGRGVVVYDIMAQTFVGVDLDFGDVRQFAETRVAGRQRLFFYTSDNLVYEAYASEVPQICKIYLGDFAQGVRATLNHAILTFTNIKSSGSVRFSLYADKELAYDATQIVDTSYVAQSGVIQPPYTQGDVPTTVNFTFASVPNVSQFGAWIEWDFGGDLEVSDIYGEAVLGYNNTLETGISAQSTVYALLGSLKFGASFNPSTNTSVTKSFWYYFAAASSTSVLTNGSKTIKSSGFFCAEGNYVWVNDASVVSEANDAYVSVQHALDTKNVSSIILLGDVELPFFTLLKNYTIDIFSTLGDRDYSTIASRSPARYSWTIIPNAMLMMYNGGYAAPDYFTVVEPDGNNSNSNQWRYFKTWATQSKLPHKIFCVHEAPYSVDFNYPDFTNLRLPFGTIGAKLILSGNSATYERYNISGTTYINLGISGADHSATLANSPSPDVVVTGKSGYGILTITPMDLTVVARANDGTQLDFVRVSAN